MKNDILIGTIGTAATFSLTLVNIALGCIAGVLTDIATDAQLAAGRNWFTNYNGPYWAQRSLVLYWVRLKDGADPVTLLDHSAGSNGTNNWPDLVDYDSEAGSFWTAGDRGDALIADLATFTASLRNNFDVQIHNAALPVARSIVVSQIITRYAPFHR